MNASFINKAALGILLVATGLVAVWRYEVTVVQPKQSAALQSLQNDLQDRNKLKEALEDLNQIRAGIIKITDQGELNEAVVSSVQTSLTGLQELDDRLLSWNKKSVEAFGRDLNDFLKITGQLALYETKIKDFNDKFSVYFRVFENDVSVWREQAAAAMMAGNPVTNTIPVDEMAQKISTIEKIIPELAPFQQKLQDLKSSVDQWVEQLNGLATLEEKQAVFGQKQYVLKNFSDLFGTFSGYLSKTLEKEDASVRQIAGQMNASIDAIFQPLEERYGALNNAIETQMIQSKIKDRQYRDFKQFSLGGFVIVLIGLFVGLAACGFRFERAFALFRRQTSKASADSKEIAASLNDHATGMIRNFELARNYQEGLEEVAGGFKDRQLNLQRIDQLVRDTDSLIKDSRENFLGIKEEFYNTEKVSKEIVQLTGALEGVAQQMTVIAERAALTVASNDQQAHEKQNTIDELKYLSSRIRHAVGSTHSALEARKDKIDEAKTKFESIEKNMDLMTQNTRDALTEIAIARLDHSQEINRINEILENAKTKSLQIAEEINGLNRQIRDFSVLSKHLEALHELAVKASALNAQSLLVENKGQEELPAIESSSRRMNDYIKEYFAKVFESDVLKKTVKDDVRIDEHFTDPTFEKPASRIEETIKNS